MAPGAYAGVAPGAYAGETAGGGASIHCGRGCVGRLGRLARCAWTGGAPGDAPAGCAVGSMITVPCAPRPRSVPVGDLGGASIAPEAVVDGGAGRGPSAASGLAV